MPPPSREPQARGESSLVSASRPCRQKAGQGLFLEIFTLECLEMKQGDGDDEDIGYFVDDDQRQGLINPSAGEAWTSKNDSGMVHRRAGVFKSLRQSRITVSVYNVHIGFHWCLWWYLL